VRRAGAGLTAAAAREGAARPQLMMDMVRKWSWQRAVHLIRQLSLGSQLGQNMSKYIKTESVFQIFCWFVLKEKYHVLILYLIPSERKMLYAKKFKDEKQNEAWGQGTSKDQSLALTTFIC
jgi:hypothetical protein